MNTIFVNSVQNYTGEHINILCKYIKNVSGEITIKN